MSDKEMALIDENIEKALRDVKNATTDEEKKSAMNIATALIDRKIEMEKVKNANKTANFNTIITIAASFGMPVLMFVLKTIVDNNRIEQICKLEQIDALQSTPGKGLLRTWFQFKD